VISQSESALPRWLARTPRWWAPCLVMVGVLLASWYFAQRASALNLALVAGLMLAPPVLLLHARWPALGPAALVAASLLIPVAIRTGRQTQINITVLLIGALTGLWALDVLLRRDVRLARSRVHLPLFALLLAALLGFLTGQLPWFMAQPAPMRSQLGGLAIFFLSAAAFLLMGHRVPSLVWLERITWLFLALGALYMLGRLIPIPSVGRRITDLFVGGSDGALFWVWLTVMVFAQAAFNRGLRTRWRLILGGIAVATLYVALYQGRDWTSGWLPAVVAVLVALWAGAPRLGALATLAGGAVASQYLGAISDILIGGSNAYSLLTRREAWRIVLEIARVSPVFGLGPANYYWYTHLYPIFGYAVQFNSHSNYVDLIAQTGLLGLACFLWFAWQAGRLGWSLRSRVAPGFAQAYVYGALGGLAGMLVAGFLGDWVLPFVYNIGLNGMRASALGWLFLGGLVALERLLPEAGSPGATQEGEDVAQ
jgi:hypothetical protein